MSEPEVQTAEDLATAIEAVRAVAPAERPSDITMNSSQFNSTSVNGVRPGHALDAIKHADDFQVLEYQGIGMFIATRLIKVERPFVLLAVGTRIEGNWVITSAYRLYDDAAPDLAQDACRAFQAFLLRFGLHFRVGDQWVLFVPIAMSEPDEEGNLNLIELKDISERSGTVAASTRINGDGTATVAWPFAVDTGKYKSELKLHQR